MNADLKKHQETLSSFFISTMIGNNSCFKLKIKTTKAADSNDTAAIFILKTFSSAGLLIIFVFIIHQLHAFRDEEIDCHN